jgi:hypothetical protein
MKTYPIWRPDGSLHAFEITSSWIVYRPLLNIIRSVPGVTDVRRNWFKDDHIRFKFHGQPAVVNEPWGDNSRYWIRLEDPDASQEIDIRPLHEAFKEYRGYAALRFWPFG